MGIDVSVSNNADETAGEGQEAPQGDPIATLAAEAVQDAAETGAAVDVLAAEVQQVAEEVTQVAAQAVDYTEQFTRIDTWQQSTGALLTSLMEAQARMMETQEAMSLAVSGLLTPPNLSAQDVDGTPTIAPANGATPSDPVDNLPVQQAEAVIQAVEEKAKRQWV